MRIGESRAFDRAGLASMRLGIGSRVPLLDCSICQDDPFPLPFCPFQDFRALVEREMIRVYGVSGEVGVLFLYMRWWR